MLRNYKGGHPLHKRTYVVPKYPRGYIFLHYKRLRPKGVVPVRSTQGLHRRGLAWRQYQMSQEQEEWLFQREGALAGARYALVWERPHSPTGFPVWRRLWGQRRK